MAEAGMVKPIPMSRQETATSSKEAAMTKMPAIHTLNKQATLTLHNPLRNNRLTEGDSNKEVTRIATVKLRQRAVAALRIRPEQVRQVAATVRQMQWTFLGGRTLMEISRRK